MNNRRYDCGYTVEHARHFCCDCQLYNDQRNHLNASLIPFDVTDQNMLLNGNPNLDNNINSSIQETVLKYIKDTYRFTYCYKLQSLIRLLRATVQVPWVDADNNKNTNINLNIFIID